LTVLDLTFQVIESKSFLKVFFKGIEFL